MAHGQHLRHEALVGGVSNAVFNGAIAWLLLRNGPPLGWTGQSSFAADVIATALLLPFIVALIVIPLQRRKLRSGKLPAINLGPDSPLQRFADRLPGATFRAAVCFALIGLMVVSPITLAGLQLAGVETIAPAHYALFKGLWAGAMAAVLVLPMVLVALRPADLQEN